MLKKLLYRWLKVSVAFFFNLFNIVLGGNLPPFGCVSIIARDQQQRYLVLKRPEGQYAFPGGFMRWQEEPEQTALREGKEETGLHFKIERMVTCYSNPTSHFLNMSTLCIIFEAQVEGGELRSSIEGSPVWLTETQLRAKLVPSQRGVLDDYLGHP